jgi:hypothetical protein
VTARRYKTVDELLEDGRIFSLTVDKQYRVIEFRNQYIVMPRTSAGMPYDDKLFIGEIPENLKQQILDVVTVIE